MKFKSILKESTLDEQPKIIKALVRLFNIIKDDESGKYWYDKNRGTLPLTESEKIMKVIELSDVKDLQSIYDAYKIYKTLEKGLEIKDVVNGLDPEDFKVINVLLMYYFNNNFNSKKIYENEHGLWEVELYNSLKDSIHEETYWLQSWQVYDDYPACAIENEIFSRGGPIYYDFLSKEDDLTTYLLTHKRNKSNSEVLDEGRINIKPLKNLTNESIDNYFKEMFYEIAKIIENNEYILDEYIESINNKK